GRWVTVTADPMPRGAFAMWCTALGRDDLATDPRFAEEETRRENKAELMAIIEDWVLTFDTVDELDEALRRGRLVMGVVRTLKEGASTEWARQRGAIVEVTDRG